MVRKGISAFVLAACAAWLIGVMALNLYQLWAYTNGRHVKAVKKRAASAIVHTSHIFMPMVCGCCALAAVLFSISLTGYIEVFGSFFQNMGIFWVETWLFVVTWQTTNALFLLNQAPSPNWIKYVLLSIWLLYPIITPVVHIMGRLRNDSVFSALGNFQHILAELAMLVVLVVSTCKLSRVLKSHDKELEHLREGNVPLFKAHVRMVRGLAAVGLLGIIMFIYFAVLNLTPDVPFLLTVSSPAGTFTAILVLFIDVVCTSLITYFMYCPVASLSELKAEQSQSLPRGSGPRGSCPRGSLPRGSLARGSTGPTQSVQHPVALTSSNSMFLTGSDSMAAGAESLGNPMLGAARSGSTLEGSHHALIRTAVVIEDEDEAV